MKNKTEYIFGIDSYFGICFFRYPWRITLIIFLIVEILVFLLDHNLSALVKTSILFSLILIINMLIVYIFSREYCYKIIIDTHQKSIRLYRFFNRGVKSEQLNNVKVVVHGTCDIVINNNTYTVFPAVLHDIIPYLPKKTEITFSGFFGRIKKRDWERRNINLTPGKY